MAERIAKCEILIAQPDRRASGLKRLPARALRGRQGDRAIPTRSWCARHDMHAMAIPAERARDRPRRRRHQQHPGRGDAQARRAGVQRAGRQRQRGEGAGARRHAARRAQPACRRCASSAALDGDDAATRQGGRGRQEAVRRLRAAAATRSASSASGKIGSLVADAAIKLGMNVLGYDPRDHGRRRLEPAVAGAQARTASTTCCKRARLRHAARAAARATRHLSTRSDIALMQPRRGAAQLRARRRSSTRTRCSRRSTASRLECVRLRLSRAPRCSASRG